MNYEDQIAPLQYKSPVTIHPSPFNVFGIRRSVFDVQCYFTHIPSGPPS